MSDRPSKLADRIQQIVAETLEMRIKDPRLGFVTITDVRVTGDLQQATVFYTVLGDDQAVAASAAAIESARGLLRSEVGRQTGMRLTPTLAFVADAMPQSAHLIEQLLQDAKSSDERVQQIAYGAVFAGEPDPYRHDDEDEGTEQDAEADA